MATKATLGIYTTFDVHPSSSLTLVKLCGPVRFANFSKRKLNCLQNHQSNAGYYKLIIFLDQTQTVAMTTFSVVPYH